MDITVSTDRLRGELKEVYDIFVGYYGEDNVDLQESGTNNIFNLIIKWDKAVVTNEYDETITIRGVYVRIQLCCDSSYNSVKLTTPLGRPYLRRSVFTPIQWNAKYIHSHVSPSNEYNVWGGVCLGSKTQIKRLVESLQGTNSSEISLELTNMDMWKTLVWEIDKMVHTESIAGTPYIRMSDITTLKTTPIDNYPVSTYYVKELNPFYEKFIPYLLKQNVLKFVFTGSNYVIADNPSAVAIKISNCFFDFMNEAKEKGEDSPELYHVISNYTIKVIYKNGAISSFTTSNSWNNYMQVRDEVLFTFRNNPVKLVVKEFKEDENTNNINFITILSEKIIGHIICCILTYLNINYGKARRIISKELTRNGISSQAF